MLFNELSLLFYSPPSMIIYPDVYFTFVFGQGFTTQQWFCLVFETCSKLVLDLLIHMYRMAIYGHMISDVLIIDDIWVYQSPKKQYSNWSSNWWLIMKSCRFILFFLAMTFWSNGRAWQKHTTVFVPHVCLREAIGISEIAKPMAQRYHQPHVYWVVH